MVKEKYSTTILKMDALLLCSPGCGLIEGERGGEG